MPGPAPLPLITYPSWLKGAERKPPVREGGDKPASAPASSPTTYTIPPDVVTGLAKAWGKSFTKTGKSQEQGGILVRRSDGTLEWKPGKAIPLEEGGSAGFNINWEDVKAGETLVATGHTHPYTKAEGGFTKVTFSGDDLANLAVSPREPMKFVRSGETVFMARSTPEFDREIAARGEATISEEMRRTYQEAFDKSKGGTVAKAEAAARAVSEKYHLEYFTGKGNTLTKVDTSK